MISLGSQEAKIIPIGFFLEFWNFRILIHTKVPNLTLPNYFHMGKCKSLETHVAELTYFYFYFIFKPPWPPIQAQLKTKVK